MMEALVVGDSPLTLPTQCDKTMKVLDLRSLHSGGLLALGSLPKLMVKLFTKRHTGVQPMLEPKRDGTIAVYTFRSLEAGVESSRVSTFKATREDIERVLVGDVLDATEEWIEPSRLDEDGRYRRLPTGWGDLDRLG